MRWSIIDELPVLSVKAWSKVLDDKLRCYMSLRPCVHWQGLFGWALVYSGFDGPECLLAIWWKPENTNNDQAIHPDWVAEIEDCPIDLQEIGLDENDLKEINDFLKEAF